MHTATTVCVDCHLRHAAEFVLPKIMLFFSSCLMGFRLLAPSFFFGGGGFVFVGLLPLGPLFFVLVYLGSLTAVRA